MAYRRAATCLRVVIAGLTTATLVAQQPRDGGPAPTFSGSIVGTVTSGDGVPIDRAVVLVRSDALPLGRTAITDERGTFAIHQLPPGRLTITADRPGFLTGVFGATGPGRSGTPVIMTAGQTQTIAIRMTKGGVVAGRILDGQGQPVSDMVVVALDGRLPLDAQSARTLVMAAEAQAFGALLPGTIRTNDRGEYRLFGLQPGDYFIAALPADAPAAREAVKRTAGEVDAILNWLQRTSADGSQAAADALRVEMPAPANAFIKAPVFYPGTPTFAQASRVRITGGDERAGLDFVVQPVPVGSIAGIVTTPAGVSAKYQVSIAPANWIPVGLGSISSSAKIFTPAKEGGFRYMNLIPGRYRLMARGNPTWTNDLPPGTSFGDPGHLLYAVLEVDVFGTDVAGVELTLQPGARVAGRVVVDSSSTPPPFEKLRVSIAPVGQNARYFGGSITFGDTFVEQRQAEPDASGAFEIAGIAPGRYRVECQVLGESARWWLRSAVVGGRDLLDAGLDATIGTALANAVLTLTDRHTELSGVLQSSAGLPAPEYFVIAFPADASLRIPSSRRLRSTRPATDGSFSFANLPPGAYFLAALTDVDPDEWQTPEFLEALVPASVKIALGEGERKRQDLRIGR